jgi:hypothetical protein
VAAIDFCMPSTLILDESKGNEDKREIASVKYSKAAEKNGYCVNLQFWKSFCDNSAKESKRNGDLLLRQNAAGNTHTSCSNRMSKHWRQKFDQG